MILATTRNQNYHRNNPKHSIHSYRTENASHPPNNCHEDLTEYSIDDLQADQCLLQYPFLFPISKSLYISLSKNLHNLSLTIAGGDDLYSVESNINNFVWGNDSLTIDITDDNENNYDNFGKNFTTRKKILVKDYKLLDPNVWLNDSLVNMWMHWISKENECQQSVHFFSSQFYTLLSLHGANGVSTCTTKNDINVFQKKLVFIPVCDNIHWSLCVLVNPGSVQQSFCHYDESNDKVDLLPLSCILFFDSKIEKNYHSKDHKKLTLLSWLNYKWKRINSTTKDPFCTISYEMYSPSGMNI